MGDKNVKTRSRSAPPSNLDSDLKKDGCLKRKELASSSNHPRVQSISRSSIDNRPSRPSRKVYFRVRGRTVWEESETPGEKPRYRSRSRSRSSRRGDRHLCIQSRSHSRGRGRSRSHNPLSSQRRHIGTREKPKASSCLGVFGLSRNTSEEQLYTLFSKFGPLDKVQLVIDLKMGGRSRGFGFIYFKDSADAKLAKESCSGIQIDGRTIRVDYSISQKARPPTPKLYMDKHTKHCYSDRYRERESYRDRRSPSPRHRSRRYERSRSRSYSPQKYR